MSEVDYKTVFESGHCSVEQYSQGDGFRYQVHLTDGTEKVRLGFSWPYYLQAAAYAQGFSDALEHAMMVASKGV